MNLCSNETRPPRILENLVLVIAGLIAHAPLHYQLPRWAAGLDPTSVHPSWMAQSPFPPFFYAVAIHPLIWIALIVLLFARICRNYGWKVGKFS